MIRALALTLALAGCSIPLDKALHGVGGAMIATGGLSGGMMPAQSCALSIAIGIAKELHDATGRGTPEVMDAVATGGIGCIVAFILGANR